MQNYLIGIDIGRTNIKIGALDHKNKRVSPLKSYKFQTMDSAYAELSVNVIQRIRQYMNEHNISHSQLGGIGVSLPALFNRENGKIERWPNNRLWDGLEFRDLVINEFNVPLVMEDDANCAALGESFNGNANGFNHYAYITVSSGIGCGIVLNGEIYHGASGWAGELGHTLFYGEKVSCNCGNKGCIQALSSGVAIFSTIRNKLSEYEKAKYNELEEIIRKSDNRNEINLALNQAALFLSYSIFNLYMILDLQLIIIGGGVVKIGSLFTNPLTENFEKLLENVGRTCQVLFTDRETENGIYGALMLIQKKLHNMKSYPG